MDSNADTYRMNQGWKGREGWFGDRGDEDGREEEEEWEEDGLRGKRGRGILEEEKMGREDRSEEEESIV